MVSTAGEKSTSEQASESELCEATVTEAVESAAGSGDTSATRAHQCLLLVSHAGVSRTYSLEAFGEVIFGRDPAATIAIDESVVSRRHARVSRRGDQVLLEDLQSRNGTRLNDTLIRGKSQMGSGDRIQVGSAEAVLAVVRSLGNADLHALSPSTSLSDVVIADQEMRRIFSIARRLGPSTTPVLILGETGVGKEVLARAIHEGGPRQTQPFIQLNCAATPEGLMESELFGYERGAFTGATRRKIGHVEAANGGTLFLDEIGEMPASLQAKLLKFLQDRTMCRLGSVQPVVLDVRIVAATHRSIELDASEGRFRQDLYYRVAGFTLQVPPLRQRKPEILPLALTFLRNLSEQERRPMPALGTDATLALLQYSWPGNVRELRNAISHALVLAQDTINACHLPARIRDGAVTMPLGDADLAGELHAVEEAKITQILSEENGNRTHAARRLGISRRALIYKIGKFRIKPS